MSDALVARLPTVLVFLASYNGEKYISEQIRSILSQEGVRVSIRICDDRSDDATANICRSFSESHKNIHFSINESNKGLARNFMDMVFDEDADGYDYYAFSDQDDFWKPEKLKKAIEEVERRAPSGPALYYSDVENVDCRLCGGTREYYNWKCCSNELIAALTINWASGCTMVFNSDLRFRILDYRPATYPRIHDSWLHLVAMVSGSVVDDLNNSYIKRRLSDRNQVGYRNLENTLTLGNLFGRWNHAFKPSEHCQTRAASSLLDGYQSIMSREDAELVKAYAAMPYSFLERVRVAFRLLSCPFPKKRMAIVFAIKAIGNRL